MERPQREGCTPRGPGPAQPLPCCAALSLVAHCCCTAAVPQELCELLDIRMVEIRRRWQEGRLQALGFRWVWRAWGMGGQGCPLTSHRPRLACCEDPHCAPTRKPAALNCLACSLPHAAVYPALPLQRGRGVPPGGGPV